MTGHYANVLIEKISRAEGIGKWNRIYRVCAATINSVPERYCELIDYIGTEIRIVNWVPDINPSLANDTPRTWSDGSSWYHSAAAGPNSYDNCVTMALYHLNWRNKSVNTSSKRARTVLFHELGHAFAFSRGARNYISMSTLRSCMDQDLPNIGRRSRRFLSYFVPTSHGGAQTPEGAASEILAEMINEIMTGRAYYGVARNFPHCYQYINGALQRMIADFAVRRNRAPGRPAQRRGRPRGFQRQAA